MKVTEAPQGDKKFHLERLLERGTVTVILDARADSVIVPPDYKANPKLPLNLDYAFEIPDFKIMDDRVEVSLSFNRKNFFCILPFAAIYILNSTAAVETVLFPENVPPDLLNSFLPVSTQTQPPLTLVRDKSEKPKKEREKKEKKSRSHLKLVE